MPETLAQVFSCEFCEISKNIFHKHVWWLLLEIYWRKVISDFFCHPFKPSNISNSAMAEWFYHITCFKGLSDTVFFLCKHFYHKKVVTWKLQHFSHKEVMMSHMCFRINLHSTVAWMSRNSLLEAGVNLKFSDCNWTWTHHHLVHKWTLNQMIELCAPFK